MGAPLNSPDARSVTGYRRRLDPALFRLGQRWRHHAPELRQAVVPGPYRGAGAGCESGVPAVLRQTFWREETGGVRTDRERFDLSDRGSITLSLQPDGGCLAPPA